MAKRQMKQEIDDVLVVRVRGLPQMHVELGIVEVEVGHCAALVRVPRRH